MHGENDSDHEDTYQRSQRKGGSSINSKKSRANINKQSIIAKLNKSLSDENATPDDVQNILVREKTEKQRNELLKKFKNSKSIKRLSLIQV